MKKKTSFTSFLCFLLCLAMTLPASAGGVLGGSIRQDGKTHELFNSDEKSGDGWSTDSRWDTGRGHGVYYQALLTLDNFKGEEIRLYSDGSDIVLILADGSVNEVDSLWCAMDSSGALYVEGNGTLIIGELEMPDYNDPSLFMEPPLDFVKIAEGTTVTVRGKAGNEHEEEFHEPVPVIVEPPHYDDIDDEEWWNLPFTDVPDDAYYWDAVRWAIDDGITKGTSDTTFSPDAACTRGQVATFLWRAYDCPEPATMTNPFTDVSESSPFYKAILWAAERGITTGTSETTFSPGNTCTNAHVITFLWRFMYQPDASRSSALADSLPQGYYTSAVAWADSEGVLSGTDKAFDPSAPCPRADIVHYLYRAYVDIDAPIVEATH